MGFDLNAFAAAKTAVTGETRDFPLQVESFDLAATPHTVTGRDMSSGQMERVTVFLRDLKVKTGEDGKPSTYQRASLFDFGNDPFAALSDADLRNPQKMQEIMNTMNGRCTMKQGGVLMIQGAYADQASGMISAAWANRLATTADEVRQGAVTILSPVLARLTVPAQDGQMFFAEVLYPDAGLMADSAARFDEVLSDLLGSPPNGAAGRTFAAIRLTDTSDGTVATNIIDRRREKAAGYAEEPVNASIQHFWNSMPPSYVSELQARLDSGALEARIVPGVRYRFVGTSLKELKEPVEKRAGLRWEHFDVGSGQTGWMQCSVILRRYRAEEAITSDHFPVSVWPLNSGLTPSLLTSVI